MRYSISRGTTESEAESSAQHRPTVIDVVDDTGGIDVPLQVPVKQRYVPATARLEAHPERRLPREIRLAGAEVQVTGDGSHFEAVVVSEEFAGKSPIQKQRLVMATVKDQIASGELHALSIKTYTPAEWEKAKKLQVS